MTNGSKSSASSKKKSSQAPGKTAPDEPAEEVNKKDQKRLQMTMPGRGFMLARLIPLKERSSHGFSKDSRAYQSAAMLEVIRHHPDDDNGQSSYPSQSLIFANLEEVAPLLNTHIFLVPMSRIMGRLASKGENLEAESDPVGFVNDH